LIGGSRLLKGYVEREYRIERKVLRGERSVRSVLVIGGGGYIGSLLVRQLLQAGYRVRVLDELLYGMPSLRLCATTRGSGFYATIFAMWKSWSRR
jgi:hypothetical protein